MQQPLPDELLSSCWVRSARRAGLSLGVATFSLTGRKWYPSFFQAGHLKALAEVTRTCTQDLLDRHTIIPYATAFSTPQARARARQGATSHCEETHIFSAFVQGVSELVPSRRWCPRCAVSDASKFGESYWHRVHNLPGVALCLTHGTSLVEGSIPTKDLNRSFTALPHELRGGMQLCARATPFLRDVARISAGLLEPEAQARGTAEHYLSELRERGLLGEEKPVSASQLRAAVRAQASEIRLFGFTPDLQWLPLLLRPRSAVPFVTAKHVFFQAALLHGKQKEHRLDHVSTGCTPRDRATEDARLARELREVLRERVKAGSTIRVEDALRKIGCWGTFRHDRTRYPKLARVVYSLRRSPASARFLREVV